MRPDSGPPTAIVARICNTECSEVDALSALQEEYARNPQVDCDLLNWVRQNDQAWLPRVLRLLSTVSSGQRLVPGLLPLLENRDSAVRALAALLLAKGRSNPHWAMEMLKDADPRVRANVVEGVRVWSLDLELLAVALNDKHHRVVANAIVSLHKLEPAQAMDRLGAMLRNDDWNFRAAAAWACGAIGIPECAALVRGMRHDPHPSVRWNALRAHAVIHRANRR